MKSEELKVKSFKMSIGVIRPVRIFIYLSLITFHFSLLTINAQDDPNDLAPPPLRTVSKDEKALLNEQSDIKAHTKLALAMMNSRLTHAEILNSNSDFEGMFRELGGFHGLLDNTLDFLGKHDTNSGKVLDNYKRLEIGLRAFTPRLEAIRRDLSLRYEDYVRQLVKYVREARTRAVEPLFSDTVVPVRKPG